MSREQRLRYDSAFSSSIEDDSDVDCSCYYGFLRCVKRFLRGNLFAVLLAIGITIGVTMGSSLRVVLDYKDLRSIWYFQFPGRLMFDMLELLSIPILITSIAMGTSEAGPSVDGKIGAAALLYYSTSSFAASVLAIILTTVTHPGQYGGPHAQQEGYESLSFSGIDAFIDFTNMMLPNNIVTVFFELTETQYEPVTVIKPGKGVNDSSTTIHTDKPKTVTMYNLPNVMGLIVIAGSAGLLLSQQGHSGVALKKLVIASNKLAMKALKPVVWYVPFGVTFLIAGHFIASRNVFHTVPADVARYISIMYLAVLIQSAVILPLVYYVMTGRNPVLFWVRQLSALLTALGTSSSMATLPVTMECLIMKNHVDRNVVDIVAPVGVPLNMDGTAIYNAVVTVYIAQTNGVDLSLLHLCGISLMVIVSTFITVPFPSAKPTMMLILLDAVGLPSGGLAIINSITWLVDPVCTMLNVWSDAICSGILDHYYSDLLHEIERKNILEHALMFPHHDSEYKAEVEPQPQAKLSTATRKSSAYSRKSVTINLEDGNE